MRHSSPKIANEPPPDGARSGGDRLITPLRAKQRRIVFFGSILLATALATACLSYLFWLDGWHRAHAPMLAIFFVLHGLLVLGAAHAVFGLWAGSSGPRAVKITDLALRHPGPLRHRYAIVMPVYEEDCERFCARLEAIFRSIMDTGHGGSFDFFLLSDTRNGDLWIQEETAWANLCRHLNAFGKIFYRRRRENTNRKAGNIADFVRKSGASYEAMLVLDADSLMEGEDILRMARVMEMSPKLGILQTPPKIILGQSPFARTQQFIMAAMGPLFVRGLNYWQLGEGSYWGHNALVRLRPFSEFCELPALPGNEPFGGRIFSHDFVEAALLVRAGWEVWLAWDIDGTYEESPPTLVDHLVRDRRWCQGNLQHLWLLMARKLRVTVRMHLLGGVLGYVSSPLWFCFLFLGTWLAWDRNHSGLSKLPFTGPLERMAGISPELQTALLMAWVLALLFGPRLLAAVRTLRSRELRTSFGGGAAFLRSLGAELSLSMLLSPIIMISHSQSVLGILLGRSVGWNPQSRGGDGTGWGDAWRFHAPAFLIGLLWAWICWHAGPGFFWWMLPVLSGLLLAAPLSVWTSRPSVGAWLATHGFWLTPEQTGPAKVIRAAAKASASRDESLEASHADRPGLIAAAIDPYVNAIHISLLEAGESNAQAGGDSEDSPGMQAANRCLVEGPGVLGKLDRETLLQDARALLHLHRSIWLEPAGGIHVSWLEAMDSYRFSQQSKRRSLGTENTDCRVTK